MTTGQGTDQPTVEPTAQGTAQGNSGHQPTDWEASYKGMQREFQKLQAGSARAVADLTTARDALQEQITKQDAAIQQLNADIVIRDRKIKDLEDVLNSEKSAASKTVTALARSKLIMKEFPDLSAFEAADTLPSGDNVEELRVKFSAFRNILKQNVGNGVAATMTGASPTLQTATTPTTGSASADDIYRRMSAAIRSGDMKTYDALYPQWMESMSKNK